MSLLETSTLLNELLLLIISSAAVDRVKFLTSDMNTPHTLPLIQISY